MAAEENETKPMVGEILPPERRGHQLPQPNTPVGIPVLVQAKYWAARRKLESYTKAIAAQAAAYQALEERNRARIGFEESLVRIEHLDDLRRIEELKIVAEELKILKEVASLADLVEGSAVDQNRTRALKAQTQGEAIEAERRLEAIKNPPAPVSKDERSAVQRTGTDIVQIRRDMEELKKTIIECYGGEDKLTEEDQDLLQQVEVATRNKIIERLENL